MSVYSITFYHKREPKKVENALKDSRLGNINARRTK